MEAPPVTLYTIGHSTRSLQELIAALQAHNIRTLVDIRAFPVSRRLPHFNRESLEEELPRHGIAYVWRKELGGRRKKMRDDSPNTGLRNDSFRNYADYMMTEEFGAAIDELVKIADPTLSAKEADEGRVPADSRHNRGPSTAIGRSRDLTPLGMTNEGKGGAPVAIMCAERVYFQCHRMLVSDYLTAHGHKVLHIDDEKRPVREHKLMSEARLVAGKLIYNAQQLFRGSKEAPSD